MPDGAIKVSYATLHGAAEDCNTTSSQLQQSFDRLQDDLKPLVNSWSGHAKDAYHHAQDQWNQKFNDLKQVLAQIASALPQIAEGYQSTDKNAETLFH